MKKVKIKNNSGEEIEVTEEFAIAYNKAQKQGDSVKDGDEDLPIDEFKDDFKN